MSDYYIGLMSGTSLDGVDGVLLDLSAPALRVIASANAPFSIHFKAALLALNSPGHNELHKTARAANQLAGVYANVVHALLEQTAGEGIKAEHISAIGAHGQTVRHQPQPTSPGPAGAGYTLQLNNPALLAELTGIDVVADFRSRDVAAGGQGAPLVPAFHAGVFGRADATVAVLNIGGIANLSVLPAGAIGNVIGFDCGPGNVLMDAWCQQHTSQPYDDGGQWAASGKVNAELLAGLLDEPYFAQPLPKSTGRDLFSMVWLRHKLAPFLSTGTVKPQDIQATLTEFTARTCIADVKRYAQDANTLIVCGGGAFNRDLMQRIQAGLPGINVVSSDAHGLPPLQVEAAAFAWLAQRTIKREPGNLPGVTGAAGPRILGAIYPA